MMTPDDHRGAYLDSDSRAIDIGDPAPGLEPHRVIPHNDEARSFASAPEAIAYAYALMVAASLDPRSTIAASDAAIIDIDPRHASIDAYVRAVNLNAFFEASHGAVSGRWRRIDLDMIRNALGRDPNDTQEISSLLEHGVLDLLLEDHADRQRAEQQQVECAQSAAATVNHNEAHPTAPPDMEAAA